jgi:hypothetical protein
MFKPLSVVDVYAPVAPTTPSTPGQAWASHASLASKSQATGRSNKATGNRPTSQQAWLAQVVFNKFEI